MTTILFSPCEIIETLFTLFTGLTEGLIELLDRRRGQDGAYIGCMKSGDVISEEYVLLSELN